MMGEVTFYQVSIFFTLVGVLGTLLTWPVMLALIFTGAGKKRIDIKYKNVAFGYVSLITL